MELRSSTLTIQLGSMLVVGFRVMIKALEGRSLRRGDRRLEFAL